MVLDVVIIANTHPHAHVGFNVKVGYETSLMSLICFRAFYNPMTA